MGHLCVSLPVGVYAALHLAGLRFPSALWGTDLLAYYPPAVTAIFVAVPVLFAILPLPRPPLPRPPAALARITAAVLHRRFLPPVLFLAAVPLFYLFRDRSHHLGDSAKWFAIIEFAVLKNRPFDDIPWHNASLDLPGLEFINFQQALDLVVHYAAFAVGERLLGWTPIDAYEWVSCAAGGLYLAALWGLAGRLAPGAPARATLFLFLASLGTIQLFFGYGESYTLVTLLSAIYLCTALDCLRGRRPLWAPGLVLAVAAATHMLALSLVPSWVYLAWRDARLGPLLKQRRFWVPAVLAGLAAGAWAYLHLYRGLHLPLLDPAEEGRYGILSLAHAGTLGNQVLLLSPFGAVWAALARRAPGHPARTVLGLGAVGAGLLIGVHDITMGGRDWDLMSFPGLLYSAWGFVCLQGLVGDTAPRLVCRRVLPVMALHAALWVGVNADPDRALARLGNLLRGRANQAVHYQQWALGYYYLEVADRRYAEAERAFAAAIAAAPKDQLDTPGTRPFTYRKFHAFALAGVGGRRLEALQEIRDLYRLQSEPPYERDDLNLHHEWGRIAYALAEDANAAGDTAAARSLYEESRVALERIVAWEPTPQAYLELAVVLRRLGRHRDAIACRALGLEPGEDPVGAMIDVGDGYLAEGEPGLAAFAYTRLLEDMAGVPAPGYLRAGIRLYRAGDRAASTRAYRRALELDPDLHQAHLNLGWNLFLDGDTAAALDHWLRAAALESNAETLFNLGMAYLRSGRLDSANAVYARAVNAFGAAEGVRVGAHANLDWLIARGIQTEGARRIRARYWGQE